uniref:N-acetylglucosaminylphosphatidylinositol deacetylase n=1 Tax=Arabidopsis thaliana TaxID=3702 RepID=Q9XIP1_ARATH|nr:similar to PIG-L [Arabidopsis thaliana]AAM15175.1 similar to PIG-L [Arabidopsis thaliana]
MVVVFLSLIVVIWVASFFKIFFRATSISRATILDDGKFFSPTINYFTSTACNLHILCFSTGNADGMGSIRDQELHRACAVLKVIPFDKEGICDNDSCHCNEEHIITFDNYGVWGHCNHRDVHPPIDCKIDSAKRIHGFLYVHQVSLNIFRKYCGPVDIWLSILSAKRHPSKVIIINKQPWKSFKAMAQHLSQWVWFRKLFVLFSSYTYVNTLDRINPESNELL